jgi:hypothetical protein
MNDEQQEAKILHAAQAFTNVVFGYTISAHAAMRLKTGREQADAFYGALISAIDEARKVGADETLASESPFSSVEAEILTLHAALFAFNQFSPLRTVEMKELCDGALECVGNVVKDRESKGVHDKIDPEFVISQGDDGQINMGVRLKDKSTSD